MDVCDYYDTTCDYFEVEDGLGNRYVMNGAGVGINENNIPATAAELFEFIDQVHQGFDVAFIDRFRSGAFGPGLSGVCERVSIGSQFNVGAVAGSGVAGGSTTASGRSVTSVSSARERASAQKKRRKKSKERQDGEANAYLRLASADGAASFAADIAGVKPLGVETFVDFRGGYRTLKRDASDLEPGFDGETVFGVGSISAALSNFLAVTGSFSYLKSNGHFDAGNRFTERNSEAGLFFVGEIPLVGVFGDRFPPIEAAAGAFLGDGKGSSQRSFLTTRSLSFEMEELCPCDPDSPGYFFVTYDLPISDDLLGEYDTRNYGFSAAAAVSFDMGGFVVAPGVEFTHFTFKQDGYEETVADAFNNGLALSYSEFKDKWTETRIGGAIARDFGPFRLEGYGDLVLTGNAATPVRTATFVEDLRANPYVLSYRVDALDKTFGVFGLVAAAGIGEGVEAFVGGETNVGHDYLTARTIFGGVRFTP